MGARQRSVPVPSKLEMDTFLLGMGEAMACGAIPIATAQAGMRHFGHSPAPEADPDATGLAAAVFPRRTTRC